MEQIGNCPRRFHWCGRWVTLSSIWGFTHGRRPGRWINVQERDGTRHRLHYYDDELVRVPSPNPDHQQEG